MALGDMSVQEMASALGVSRTTCARWMHDRGAAPKRAYVLQWALLTGTSASWLEYGEAQPDGPTGGVPVTSRYVVPQTPRLRALSAA